MKLNRFLGLSLVAIGLNSLIFCTNAFEDNSIIERISYISNHYAQGNENYRKGIEEKEALLDKYEIDTKYAYLYYTLFPDTPKERLGEVKEIFEKDTERCTIIQDNQRMIYSFLYVNLYEKRYTEFMDDLASKSNLLLGILTCHGHIYAKAYSDAIIMGLSEEEASVRALIYDRMVAEGKKNEDYIKEYSIIVARKGDFKQADVCATEYEKRLEEMGPKKAKEAKITARCNFSNITNRKSLELVKAAILRRGYNEANINKIIKEKLKLYIYKRAETKKDTTKKRSKVEVPSDVKKRVLDAIGYNQLLRENSGYVGGTIAIEYAKCKKMGKSDKYSLTYAQEIGGEHSIEEADIKAKREEKE